MNGACFDLFVFVKIKILTNHFLQECRVTDRQAPNTRAHGEG